MPDLPADIAGLRLVFEEYAAVGGPVVADPVGHLRAVEDYLHGVSFSHPAGKENSRVVIVVD